MMPDRADVVAAAAHAFWTGARHDATFSPRVQAERAHYIGGPSVEVLEALILAEHGLSSERTA